MSSKTQLVVIQPTPFCNINCRYCYLADRINRKRISMETLAQIFQVFFSSPFVSDKITFVWHASEPLVLPIDFYEQAFQLQRSANQQGVQVINAFQTNALLITQQWCDFFKAHAIRIGVSLDGPQHIHDANRVDRAGHGTFKRAIKGIDLLRANRLDYAVIAVITKATLHDPEGFWQFFFELAPAHLGLNAEETEGANLHSSLPGSTTTMQLYKRFIEYFLHRKDQAGSMLRVRDIEVLKQQITSGKLHRRAQTSTPMAMLSFDCDGNISTFSPELLTMTHPTYGNFTFGTVFDGTLENIVRQPKFMAINQQIQRGIARCQAHCEYFALCGGGHPSNKISENGTFDSSETLSCRLNIQVTADALLEHLEKKYYLDAP